MLQPFFVQHQGLSYHWAPYWDECPPCSPLTAPHLVLRLENLKTDLPKLLHRWVFFCLLSFSMFLSYIVSLSSNVFLSSIVFLSQRVEN